MKNTYGRRLGTTLVALGAMAGVLSMAETARCRAAPRRHHLVCPQHQGQSADAGRQLLRHHLLPGDVELRHVRHGRRREIPQLVHLLGRDETFTAKLYHHASYVPAAGGGRYTGASYELKVSVKTSAGVVTQCTPAFTRGSNYGGTVNGSFPLTWSQQVVTSGSYPNYYWKNLSCGAHGTIQPYFELEEGKRTGDVPA